MRIKYAVNLTHGKQAINLQIIRNIAAYPG
jgi:hypothetical protein